jgi:hypothetical protein
VLVAEEQKTLAAHEFFNNILGTLASRVSSLNMELLDLPCIDLVHLGERFTEGEVLAMIRALPPDKAGFTRHFLQVAWKIIRGNMMCTFDAFWHMDMRNFSSINYALLSLLLKSAEANCIKDY